MSVTNTEAPIIDPQAENIDVDTQVDGVTEVPPVVAPVEPQTQEPPLTARERNLMNKARTEEKSKLYKEQQNLRTKIADLERQIQTAPPRDPQGNTNIDGVGELRSEIVALRDELRQSKNQSEIREYRAQRIAEVRESDSDVIESFVTGNTKEDIDIAIEIARAEYEMIRDKVVQKHGQPRTNNINGVSRSRPEGVPAAPRQPSQVGSDSDSLSISEVLNAIGGGAGVRNGQYAAIREKVLAQLRSGRSFRQG